MPVDVAGMSFSGPEVAKQTYDLVSMDNRAAHSRIDKSMQRLGDAKSEFPLGGETAWGTFCQDVSSFSQASFSVGAGLTTGVMALPDALLGRGRKDKDGDSVQALNEGLVGFVAKGANFVATGISEGVASGAGYVAAFVPALPTMAASKPEGASADDFGIQAGEHGTTGSNFTGDGVGRNVGGALGTGAAITMNALRLPSLAVKYTVSGCFAVGGAVVGMLFGAGHAIKHAASGRA